MSSLHEENEGNEEAHTSADTHSIGSNISESKVQSPSEASNTVLGFDLTNHTLRSILMHPMCIPLFFYLNEIPRNKATGVTLPAHLWEAFDDYSRKYTDNSMNTRCDYVFAATALDWNGGETDFTSKLLFNINHCKIGDAQLTTDGEKQIIGNWAETAKVDFIFHEKEKDKDGNSSVIALFEFGLESKIWWTKHHQLLLYVKMLLSNKDPNYKINQPILLSVITINQKESVMNDANIVQWIKKKDDRLSPAEKDELKQSRINLFEGNLSRVSPVTSDNTPESTTLVNIQEKTFMARFGVFLCIPKKKNQFRIALLWRHESTNLKDASLQFGKIIYSVQLCSHLRKPSNLNQKEIGYTYLGPNCCKIGDMMFRSYDNRLRPTDRSPKLYLDKEIVINDAKGPVAKKVLEIHDAAYFLDFGQSLQPPPTDHTRNYTIDWLWKYGGKLLIIAAPYHDGVHYATQPVHFLPIINHLEKLHEQQIVHGDIRAYNMVLKYEISRSITTSTDGYTSTGSSDLTVDGSCQGWLIDFDFGGKHGVVTYPTAYKQSLPDGERPGVPEKKITIMDDWQSLMRLILEKYHVMDHPGAESVSEQKSLTIHKMRNALISYATEEVDSTDPQISDYKFPADHLRKYIYYISDVCYVKPSSGFMTDLKHCGLLRNNSQLISTDAIPIVDKGPSGVATGSPQPHHQ